MQWNSVPLLRGGGDYEVDAVGFCGIPNDFQYGGIAKVLVGDANATGGLTDTYVYDNSYNPAVVNMGQQEYSDLDTIANFADPLGRGNNNATAATYSANKYIVEAEGVYVGYKYYETRYFDSKVNPTYKATSAVGNKAEWKYEEEVIFPFGQSLSYVPFTQKVTAVNMDVTEKGLTTATVEVKNEGNKDSYFLAQLYVNRPYTATNRTNKVEKSAVDFLNSKKVHVKQGATETIEISVPTRYLASWDSKAKGGKGTYVLDEGDYNFTAAAGAHAAVNNFVTKHGGTPDGTTTAGEVVTKNIASRNETTYATSNGTEVKNRMENSDINYFLGEEKVNYLSRSDWSKFVKNYTEYENDSGIAPEAKFEIKSAAKKDEWLKELINAQYKITPSADESKWASVDGELPEKVTGHLVVNDGRADTFMTVWQWIMSIATSKPEAFANIKSAEWQAVKDAIPLDAAIASVIQGGGKTREVLGIGNPGSRQSESVAGYQQTMQLEGGKTFKTNIASNTLLGSSFNPDLAYEWGLLEGESGLWLQKLGAYDSYPNNAGTVWGAGLNQHRHPYCGRNSEYMSEDPMLTNRIGEAQIRGTVERGAICGPKHMGFNDQELNRVGNAAYMTEQKVRETDTRCYEGALRADEGNGTGVMMSFARIGATNVTNSEGYVKGIMRDEWGFTGIISTDMGRSPNYHEAGALIVATVQELAGFGGGDFLMVDPVTGEPSKEDDAIVTAKTNYITLGNARKDPKFVDRARETALYLLFTIARSGSGMNVDLVENDGRTVAAYTIHHSDPAGRLEVAPWENIFISLEVVFGILTALAGAAWIVSVVVPKKEEN